MQIEYDPFLDLSVPRTRIENQQTRMHNSQTSVSKQLVRAYVLKTRVDRCSGMEHHRTARAIGVRLGPGIEPEQGIRPVQRALC